jgi:hypothetical protein
MHQREITYSLAHLRRMTDGTGMLQHAIFSVPNYTEGYDTDDNARALIAAIYLESSPAPDSSANSDTSSTSDTTDMPDLAARYLAFLWYAFNQSTGRFRNFMSYDRRWLDEAGSDDSHARALWAVGTVLGRSERPGPRGVAAKLFEGGLAAARGFDHPRSWAFTLLGLDQYLRRCPDHQPAQHLRADLAARLLRGLEATRDANWLWFEDILTYDNATLARALLLAGHAMRRPEMVEAALSALDWLVRVQRPDDGYFVPIGSNGFYPRHGARARFDQQPIEAYATVAACLEAYRITGQQRWQAEASSAFAWFLGANDRQSPMYDPQSGGCYDGLEADRINQNQGAESTLAYLLSALDWQLTAREVSAT